TEMWEHPAVQDNLARLRSRGVHVVAPGVGRLAGGDFGPGRLAEPGDIVASVSAVLLTLGQPACAPVSSHQSLAGRQVLVTAGGTREPIDPVRYLGNRSSGRQGYALAAEARARGASVILVSAVPGAGRAGGGGRRGSEGGLLLPPEVEVVPVDTAEQMANAVASHAPGADVVIMAAAVADFRPKAAFDHKLKKADGVPELLFEPTPDILAELGRTRRPAPDQLLVGFAAETAGGDAAVLEANALDKLRRKHLDLVVANDVSAPGVGFGYATNAVLIVAADGDSIAVPLGDKTAIAAAVLDAVVSRLSAPGPPEPRSSP
ncbi:MAG: bifunctional phosphopantothenoylcysteine decarboxylase/phosphopantothenate synthase, partial [Acidimicrobiales bacterium]